MTEHLLTHLLTLTSRSINRQLTGLMWTAGHHLWVTAVYCKTMKTLPFIYHLKLKENVHTQVFFFFFFCSYLKYLVSLSERNPTPTWTRMRNIPVFVHFKKTKKTNLYPFSLKPDGPAPETLGQLDLFWPAHTWHQGYSHSNSVDLNF